jgi:sterol 3beta-glucosyltransferase
MPGRKSQQLESQATQDMSSSQFLTPLELKNDSVEHQQGELSSKLKVKRRPSDDETPVEKRRPSDRRSRHRSSTSIGRSKAPGTLAKRLQQIFEFESLEEVISGEGSHLGHKPLLT